MDDKKQESQKTVVAFVAGLLIGGLLVWVFSASPEVAAPTTNTDDNDSAEVDAGDDVVVDSTTSDSSNNESEEVVVTDFSDSVPDQSAGFSVSLGDSVRFPTEKGWVVVHEEINGDLGNALGAARYDLEVGLIPTEVALLRATIAGNTYHVVYYTESGDNKFDIREDAPVLTENGDVFRTSFKAE